VSNYRITIHTETGKSSRIVAEAELKRALLAAGAPVATLPHRKAENGRTHTAADGSVITSTEVGLAATARNLGTVAATLGKLGTRRGAGKTPEAFRHAADGSTEYRDQDGNVRRASFWSNGPRASTVWAVDLADRRYVMLAADRDGGYRATA
jgi:hypothetical protein